MSPSRAKSFWIASLLVSTIASQILSPCGIQSDAATSHESSAYREAHHHVMQRHFDLAATKARVLAEKGHAKAQTLLGILYENGLGVNKDLKLAIFWLEKAASQELKEAENHLGNLYLEGKKVEQDFDKAEMWLKKAAQHGVREAQTHLGLMYLDDKAARKDVHSAEVWLHAAALQDSEEAKKKLETIPGVKQFEARSKASAKDYSDGLYNIKDSWAGYGEIIKSVNSAATPLTP